MEQDYRPFHCWVRKEAPLCGTAFCSGFMGGFKAGLGQFFTFCSSSRFTVGRKDTLPRTTFRTEMSKRRKGQKDTRMVNDFEKTAKTDGFENPGFYSFFNDRMAGRVPFRHFYQLLIINPGKTGRLREILSGIKRRLRTLRGV